MNQGEKAYKSVPGQYLIEKLQSVRSGISDIVEKYLNSGGKTVEFHLLTLGNGYFGVLVTLDGEKPIYILSRGNENKVVDEKVKSTLLTMNNGRCLEYRMIDTGLFSTAVQKMMKNPDAIDTSQIFI